MDESNIKMESILVFVRISLRIMCNIHIITHNAILYLPFVNELFQWRALWHCQKLRNKYIEPNWGLWILLGSLFIHIDIKKNFAEYLRNKRMTAKKHLHLNCCKEVIL